MVDIRGIGPQPAQIIAIPLAMFIDGHQRTVFTLGRACDVDGISRALGIPTSGAWEDRMKPKEIARAYPGSISWFAAHAGIVAIALAASIPVVIFAAVDHLLRRGWQIP